MISRAWPNAAMAINGAYESKNKDVGEHRSNSPGMDDSVSVAGAACEGASHKMLTAPL
jgi:hypothetical protein